MSNSDPRVVDGNRDEAKAAAHTAGPWCWYGSTYGDGQVYLATEHSGRRFIMGFERAGFKGAQPTFQVNSRMVPASELVRFDVAPHVMGKAAGKASGEVYRYDFSVIDHPDARLIAAAPDLLEALKPFAQLPLPSEMHVADDWHSTMDRHLHVILTDAIRAARQAISRAEGGQ